MRGVISGVALLAACGGRQPAEAPETPALPPVEAARLADTLVLTTRAGYEIWLAEGREAKAEDGSTCVERSVEIRRDGTTRKVPLLFVSTPPVELDRDHIRADLSRDCRPTDRYRVELATGRPFRMEAR